MHFCAHVTAEIRDLKPVHRGEQQWRAKPAAVNHPVRVRFSGPAGQYDWLWLLAATSGTVLLQYIRLFSTGGDSLEVFLQ